MQKNDNGLPELSKEVGTISQQQGMDINIQTYCELLNTTELLCPTRLASSVVYGSHFKQVRVLKIVTTFLMIS